MKKPRRAGNGGRPRAMLACLDGACPECSKSQLFNAHITAAFAEWPGTNFGVVYECWLCHCQMLLGDLHGVIAGREPPEEEVVPLADAPVADQGGEPERKDP